MVTDPFVWRMQFNLAYTFLDYRTKIMVKTVKPLKPPGLKVIWSVSLYETRTNFLKLGYTRTMKQWNDGSWWEDFISCPTVKALCCIPK